MATQTYVTNMQNLPNQGNGQQTKTVQLQNAGGQAAIIQQAHGGQQFIVTTAVPEQAHEHQGGGETVTLQGQTQAVYPTQIQQSYGNDYSQSGMYSSGNFYTSPGQQMSQVQGIPAAQIQSVFTHGGGTYLVQGGTMDGEGHPITHTTRASPATVQWLIDHFETCEGVSLPRGTLFNLYLLHCSETKQDPVNPAAFGKVIRSVFIGLRTRRLGCRGNSKYHYYGIRIKASSPLNQFTDDQTMAMRQQPMNPSKRFKPANTKEEADPAFGGTNSNDSQQSQHQQFLGDASGAVPSLGSISLDGVTLPAGIARGHVIAFEKLYKEHCEAMLDVVVNLQFSLFEALWQSFWRNPTAIPTAETDLEKRLPKNQLYALCKLDCVQEFVRKSDYAFYQALVEVLIPDVLRPIPSSLTQAIRNFAKSLEGWLKNSMQGVPEEMLKTKCAAVVAFAQTLRRYTSLNHLAQAARAVLQNTSQINQMLADLNRVDFANVQEQASWVCQCEDGVVHQLEQDFKKTLQQQNSLEQWAVWLEGVVNKVLLVHEGSDNFPKAARQFLLKWSFYSSMVIRDLTLRSAASFGSFHLIRLLYDEYMFYLVEHKVASATGDTPIAVMGEFIDISSAIQLASMDAKSADSTDSHTPITAPDAPVTTVGGAMDKVNQTLGNAGTKLVQISKPNTTGAAPKIVQITAAGTTHGQQGVAKTVHLVKPTNTITSLASGTTVTVVASGSGTSGAKTIVVVPVTSTGGDGQITKKKKVPTATLR